jgi:uncharacterized protein with PIN domain
MSAQGLATSALVDESGAVADPRAVHISPAGRMTPGLRGKANATQQGGSVDEPVSPGTVRLRFHPALRFLLPRRCRDLGGLDLPHDPTATVGHLVQSAGVPLTEVGDLFVAGVPVPSRSRLQAQARLDVVVRARPQPLQGPALFLLDVHLGALARRLRLLGVDTAYERDADDDHLVERAAREDRVLLSRDRGLLMRRSLRRAAFVRGQHPDAQLADVIGRFQPPLQPWSMCVSCGGTLHPVSKAEVAEQLEPGTLRSQHQFARCRSCGHVYWHGAHDAMLQNVVRRHTSEAKINGAVVATHAAQKRPQQDAD